MNSWVNKLLAPILHSHGFKEKESFQDNKFSVFGTTRPDFAFFKNSQKQLIVMVDENGSELMNFEGNIVQNVIEYKNKDITKHFCQVYANMIRIANDSTIDCLQRGVLVDSVTVYALLVSYADHSSVPMKYYCNFQHAPTIEVGVLGNFFIVFCNANCLLFN